MPRSLNDIMASVDNSLPPVGKHLCRCIGAKRWVSPKKHTAAIMLTLASHDGNYQFEDPIYITRDALRRLVVVARHLCAMDETSKQIPDSGEEAAEYLAERILLTAIGRDAIVTIVEEDRGETVITDGPDMGQKRKMTRRKVAFGGYETPTELQPVIKDNPGDVPF